jgi:exodeoxyribonuclease VII small subunit
MSQSKSDCSPAFDPTYNGFLSFNRCHMTKAKTPSAPASAVDTVPASYETALAELEALVSRMESGQMPLADMLISYQRGAFLLAHCREQLQAVEQQIQVLEAGVLKQGLGSDE